MLGHRSRRKACTRSHYQQPGCGVDQNTGLWWQQWTVRRSSYSSWLGVDLGLYLAQRHGWSTSASVRAVNKHVELRALWRPHAATSGQHATATDSLRRLGCGNRVLGLGTRQESQPAAEAMAGRRTTSRYTVFFSISSIAQGGWRIKVEHTRLTEIGHSKGVLETISVDRSLFVAVKSGHVELPNTMLLNTTTFMQWYRLAIFCNCPIAQLT